MTLYIRDMEPNLTSNLLSELPVKLLRKLKPRVQLILGESVDRSGVRLCAHNPVVTLTGADKSGVKSGADVVSAVPHAINDIPKQSNTLNTCKSNSTEIRPNMTTITSNNRMIAPKPIATTSSIPIRPETIADKVLKKIELYFGSNLDKTQTVIITTSADSSVNSTISGAKYGINKMIPINSHIALVTSPDGTSMLAVPMSSLVAKGNVNIKSSVTPVSISSAALKSKPPIITPLKILPLMASTTSSAAISVPSISHSKNVQTLIAPASVAINKGLTNQSFTSTNTGLTLIPTTISKIVSSGELLSESTVPSVVANTSSHTNKEETAVKTEDKSQSPLPPPLLAQNMSKFVDSEFEITSGQNSDSILPFHNLDHRIHFLDSVFELMFGFMATDVKAGGVMFATTNGTVLSERSSPEETILEIVVGINVRPVLVDVNDWLVSPLLMATDAGAISVWTFLEWDIDGTEIAVEEVVDAINGSIFKGVIIGGLDFKAAELIETGVTDDLMLTFPFATNEDMGTANMDVPSGE
ncbi:unnamed protein product, partial [Medioppia subpectinata]